MTDNAIKQYLKELSEMLCCDNKKKKKILSNFKIRLSEFKSEHAETPLFYEQIIEQFGTPKEVADSLLSETNSAQVHKLIRKNSAKRFFIVITCILVVLMLLIWSICKIYNRYITQFDYIIEINYNNESLDIDMSDYDFIEKY